jgi:hypothetical protein
MPSDCPTANNEPSALNLQHMTSLVQSLQIETK